MQLVFAVPLLVLAYFIFRLTATLISFWINNQKLQDFPKPSYRFPFLSAAFGGKDDIVKITEELLAKDPNADFYNFGIHLQGSPVVMINNLDAAKEVFSNEERYPKLIESAAKLLVGQGLLTSMGEFWKQERRRLTPGFHFGTLKELVPTMVDQSRMFVDRMKAINGSWIPAKQVFVSVTLRIIIATAFGGEFDADWMEEKWSIVLKKILSFILFHTVFGRVANYLPMTSSFRKSNQEITERAKELIAKRRQIPAENQSKADIIGLMLHHGEQDDNLILDEIKTFLLAGHETTSTLLSWTCYFFGKHPDVQEKAYQEVMEVLGDREPTGDNISKLKYLKAVVEETLRLRPVVTLLPIRISSEEVTLAGRTFAPGTFFSIYIIGAHWNEKNWTNANQFIPERFLEGGKDMKKHPFAFIPFSAGPRNCIGQKFSLQESVIILSMMLQNFTIVIDDTKLHPVSAPTFAAEGLSIKFLPRLK